MEFLQISEDLIMQFSREGLDLLPAVRDRFGPLFFPSHPELPNFTWDELRTGIYLKNSCNHDREQRVGDTGLYYYLFKTLGE